MYFKEMTTFIQQGHIQLFKSNRKDFCFQINIKPDNCFQH